MLWIWVCVYVFKNHYSICLLYSILQTKVCILHIIVLSSSLLCALRCAIYYIFITFHIHGVWIELTTDEISFQISLHFKIQFNWEKIDWKEENLLTEFFSQKCSMTFILPRDDSRIKLHMPDKTNLPSPPAEYSDELFNAMLCQLRLFSRVPQSWHR